MGGATHFTLQCGRRLRDGRYQEPVVALVCSFGLSSGGLMSPDQAKTLFHEFGHALHSLLSRTEFQHLAGKHTLAPAHISAAVPSGRPCQVLLMQVTASVESWHVVPSICSNHEDRDLLCHCDC